MEKNFSVLLSTVARKDEAGAAASSAAGAAASRLAEGSAVALALAVGL